MAFMAGPHDSAALPAGSAVRGSDTARGPRFAARPTLGFGDKPQKLFTELRNLTCTLRGDRNELIADPEEHLFATRSSTTIFATRLAPAIQEPSASPLQQLHLMRAFV